MAQAIQAGKPASSRPAGSAGDSTGIPNLTDKQRKAVKEALLKFKRFWNASPGTPNEDAAADNLIDAAFVLARELV